MGFHKNMLQEHLWKLMFFQSMEVPWIWMREVPSLAWRNLRGSGLLAETSSFSEAFFVHPPLDLRLCFNKRLGKEILHEMCREGIFAVRERITSDNLESVATKRFSKDPKSLGWCVSQFRNALENSQNSTKVKGYRPIDDEAIHVYYPHSFAMKGWDEDDDNDNNQGGGNEEEEKCKCLEWGYERPEGVRPAPVPEPTNEGERHAPGHQPQPA